VARELGDNMPGVVIGIKAVHSFTIPGRKLV
jgi:hypothetical protein